MSSERSSCPICECTFKSIDKLERHVNSHFENDPSDMAANQDHAHAHQSGDHLGSVQGTVSNCVLCPLGCGQWVPLHEIDEHERLHELQGTTSKSQASHDGLGKPGERTEQRSSKAASSSGHGNADLLAALQAGLQGLPGSSADLPNDSDGQHEAWQAAKWGYGNVDDDSGDDNDAALARQLQEQQDFEMLQARYGFSTKRPGKCHICQQEGHWARDCPSNPAAACNQPRLPVSDIQQMVQLSRIEPQCVAPSGTQHVTDIMPLLSEALQQQNLPGSQAVLSGAVMHIGGQQMDRGWGCGWRNMQMQISHVLLRPSHQATLSSVLFGGKGIVPDIGSLQAWLEAAWQQGFDTSGAESLGNAIQGQTKWIGTTEAATVLRHQGIDARIIDFTSTPGGTANVDANGATIHIGVQCDKCGLCPIRGVRHHSLSRSNYDLCSACALQPDAADSGPYEQSGSPAVNPKTQQENTATVNNNMDQGQWWAPAVQRQWQQAASSTARGTGNSKMGRWAAGRGRGGRIPGPQEPLQPPSPLAIALLEWLWSYFTGGHAASCHMHSGAQVPPGDHVTASTTQVFMTDMPPLYFQHSGHSRTIVGIERKPMKSCNNSTPPPAANHNPDTARWAYTLLILDPAARPAELCDALRRASGWQRHIKRGLHTLRHAEYQLMYCNLQAAAGQSVLMSSTDREASKIIRPEDTVKR